MASTEVKRSVRAAQPKRRSLTSRQKNRLYEAVYDLNRGFGMTLDAFKRLERLEFFRGQYVRAFLNMTAEIRARTNHELTGALRDWEQGETAELGQLRLRWERHFNDAGDIALRKRRNNRLTK